MQLIMYAVLAVAAIGACVGWSNAKKGMAWGQPLTIVCAIIAIGIGFYLAYQNSFGNGGTATSRNREIEFQEVMTKKLGIHIKEKYSGKKAVVILDPYIDENDCPPLNGLKKGLDGAVEIVEILKPKAPPKPEGGEGMLGPGMLEPQDKWFTVKAVETMLTGKNFDLCITLMGLPNQTRAQGKALNIKALTGKKVFIGGGSIYNLKAAIQSGAISAAVSYKSDAIYDDKPVPSNLDEAFNKRFAFVTADNITQYKTLFR